MEYSFVKYGDWILERHPLTLVSEPTHMKKSNSRHRRRQRANSPIGCCPPPYSPLCWGYSSGGEEVRKRKMEKTFLFQKKNCVCVCVCVNVNMDASLLCRVSTSEELQKVTSAKGQLAEVSCLLFGAQRSNLGCQSWQQSTPTHWSHTASFDTISSHLRI